jgi:hypothetical protein
MVHGAENAIEIDRAVEEIPGDVTLQSTQEDIRCHGLRALRPANMDKILVAAKLELAFLEAAIAVVVVRFRAWTSAD